MSDLIMGTSLFTKPEAGGGGGVALGILDVATGGEASANPTRVIFTIPATAVAGDEMVFFTASRHSGDVHSISGGAGAPVTIGEVNSSVGSSYSLASHRYTVDAGDTPGSTQITVSSDQAFVNFSAAAITVQGTTGVDVTGAPAQVGGFSATASAPGVTTTVDDALVIFAVGQPAAVTFSSGTYTEQADFTTGTAALAVYSLTQASAGATGTLSVTASASNYNYGATVALKG